MRSVNITQDQMIDLLTPLFEHVGVDTQTVSVVKVTASDVAITYHTGVGYVTNTIQYT